MTHTDRSGSKRPARSEGDGTDPIGPPGNDGLMESLQRAPEIRRDLVARNRTRVEAHDLPDSDDVAESIVDQIISDRQS
jgi:hypothetical protein